MEYILNMKRQSGHAYRQAGLTLIEIIIYVAIVGLMSTAFVTMMINMMNLKTKSQAIQEVNLSLKFIVDKIDFEIKNASSLGTITSSSIATNRATFDLNSGNMRMTVGGTIANLNSNLVNISAFVVTNLSSGDSKTENINYSITGNYVNPGGRSEFTYSTTIESSSEVRAK